MRVHVRVNGERTAVEAEPTPFDRDRANAIFEECRRRAGCGPYSDQYERVMTPGEIAFVMQEWNANPNGASSFDSTFHYIRNGR
jgi:hypothetical protein